MCTPSTAKVRKAGKTGMAADVNIRKTPTTKTLARILDNLLEDGAVHIRK
ncbi:hypothetical protein HanIR_Chr07g0330301 [Helianthus annuus]|nr:hypothetical protein HanIR_Chr07g0330301 [Helianthus annuus]